MQKYIHPYRKIIYSFLWLIIILTLMTFYFIILKAEIIITPNIEKITTNFSVLVSEDKSPENENSIIGSIHEMTLNGEDIFLATEKKNIFKKTETLGLVTLINETSSPQPLVANTRILTPDGILLRIKNKTTVPAQGKILAEVYADDPNFSEIIQQTRLSIPGLSKERQKIIYGEIEEALGSTKEVFVIKQEDIDLAKEILAEKLEKEALKKLKEEENKDINFHFFGKLPKIKSINSKETTSIKTDKEAGDIAEKFTVAASVRVVNISFDENKLLGLARKKLINELPDDKELVEINEEDFSYTIESYNSQNNIANIKVYATGKMVIAADSKILEKTPLTRKTQNEVKEYLEAIPSVESAEVSLPAFWQKRLPARTGRIKIKILKD